jgi:hypothetical protein
VSRSRWRGNRNNCKDEYASKEEFVILFESERIALLRLALLLTANSGAADRCLALALRECIADSYVFRDWALTWARRMVIRSATTLAMGSGEQSFVRTNSNAEKELAKFSANDSLALPAEFHAILGLQMLDRFVFVICVLERYSINDCALLLSESPQDICGSRQRATDQVEQINAATVHYV